MYGFDFSKMFDASPAIFLCACDMSKTSCELVTCQNPLVQERNMLMERLMREKEEHSRRQQEEICRLQRKQDEETQFLQR